MYVYRENDLHKSMASLQRLSDASESVYESLLRIQRSLNEEQPLLGDVQTVQVLSNEHRVSLSLSVCLCLCAPRGAGAPPFPPCPFTFPSFAPFYSFSFALTIFFFCPSLSFLPE